MNACAHSTPHHTPPKTRTLTSTRFSLNALPHPPPNGQNHIEQPRREPAEQLTHLVLPAELVCVFREAIASSQTSTTFRVSVAGQISRRVDTTPNGRRVRTQSPTASRRVYLSKQTRTQYCRPTRRQLRGGWPSLCHHTSLDPSWATPSFL